MIETRKGIAVAAIGLAVSLGPAPPVQADYDDLMGYPQLLAELGAGVPTGVGIEVSMIEATSGSNDYMPNTGISSFNGVVITDESGGGVTSSHANNVALNLVGNFDTIAPAIDRLRVYEVNDHISDFLRSGKNQLPPTTDSRIANHSWVGSTGGNTPDRRILERLDYLVEEDDYLQIVGVPPNNHSLVALLASSRNAISVGLTNGNVQPGTKNLGSIYTAGRVAPTLVTPGYIANDSQIAPSWAVPQVSAAAALMLEVGADPIYSNGTINNRTRTIQHAETSEVVKAIMMTGADRFVDNVRGADLLDYVADTSNNLSSVYGAGQMNVQRNHHILTAGEQDSIEDGGPAMIEELGWDYDPAFGGQAGSNAAATYQFTADADRRMLSASLVWNADIDITPGSFSPSISRDVVDLNLDLFDVTAGAVVQDSATSAHNSEHLYFENLTPGHVYQMRVSEAEVGSFLWDYALAWRIGPEALEFLYGDMTGDWVIDADDVDPFVLALVDPAAYALQFGPNGSLIGDINRDGVFNNFDIQPFVDLLPPEALSGSALEGFAITQIPEPTTLALLATGALLTTRRRAATTDTQ